MKDAIQQIGSVAGLASFLGLGILAFLYFAQARHVRDLEEKATFVPDDIDLPTTPPVTAAAPGKAAPAAEPATKKERKAAAAAATPAAAAEAKLEAARQTEVARAAAERRQRFQQRRGSGPFTSSSDLETGSGGGGRSFPEPRAMIAIGLGVAVLIAGVVFGAARILGGSNNAGTSAGGAPAVQGTGAPVVVAVLNGTPVPGLAAKIGEQVRKAGSYKLGAVTNTATPFTVTEVMFDPADPKAQANAQTVAQALQVTKIGPITGEIKKSSEGAPVVVIVGEDRAGT